LTASKSWAKFLKDRNLRQVFDALENVDKKSTAVQAPAILMTDTKGFHEVMAHLYKRKLELVQQLWDWHVIHYLAGIDDGFLENATRSQFDVFIISCFGYSEGETARSHFNYYFSTSTIAFQTVYNARAIPDDINNAWMCPGVPYLTTNSTIAMFSKLIQNDMVLVNVNGGPKITHFGLV